MKTPTKTNLIFLSVALLIYGILTLVCWNNGYFWDNIQLTSIEAHWYYLNDFKTMLVPKHAPEYGLSGTGAPPLLPLITALLWKCIGYKLWVSHAFVALWAIILIYNTHHFLKHFFSNQYAGWVLLIVLGEAALLTQYAIASPDFILFTSLVICLRAIFEKKSLLLAFGILFLLNISTRGFFTGAILLFVHLIFYFIRKQKFASRSFVKTFLPYVPTWVLMIAYIVYYIVMQGWFFDNSNFSEAQNSPESLSFVIKHLCDFGMRFIENGQLAIWLVAFFAGWKTYKAKKHLSPDLYFLLVFFLLLTGLYLSFVFLTKMPFLTRYFIPHIFLLTILSISKLTEFIPERKTNYILVFILCFELTGHLWIYPEKVTTIWDSTLAHLPFYGLRKDCFDYIDRNNYDYRDISAGFCLYDNRRFVELGNINKTIGRDKNRKYFIYSNLSNVPDDWIDEFHDKAHWIPIRSFEKGFVVITIYKNLNYKN